MDPDDEEMVPEGEITAAAPAEEAAEGEGGNPASYQAVIGALSEMAAGAGASRQASQEAQAVAQAEALQRRQAAMAQAGSRVPPGMGTTGFAPRWTATPRY